MSFGKDAPDWMTLISGHDHQSRGGARMNDDERS
jgi:hypothetical protein